MGGTSNRMSTSKRCALASGNFPRRARNSDGHAMHAMRPLGPAASTTSLAKIPAVSSVYQNCMAKVNEATVESVQMRASSCHKEAAMHPARLLLWQSLHRLSSCKWICLRMHVHICRRKDICKEIEMELATCERPQFSEKGFCCSSAAALASDRNSFRALSVS